MVSDQGASTRLVHSTRSSSASLVSSASNITDAAIPGHPTWSHLRIVSTQRFERYTTVNDLHACLGKPSTDAAVRLDPTPDIPASDCGRGFRRSMMSRSQPLVGDICPVSRLMQRNTCSCRSLTILIRDTLSLLSAHERHARISTHQAHDPWHPGQALSEVREIETPNFVIGMTGSRADRRDKAQEQIRAVGSSANRVRSSTADRWSPNKARHRDRHGIRGFLSSLLAGESQSPIRTASRSFEALASIACEVVRS
jgi:hypothetical protein